MVRDERFVLRDHGLNPNGHIFFIYFVPYKEEEDTRGVINEYDTKGINHREDTDLTWKTPLKRRGKTTGADQQLLIIFGWLQIAGDLQLR
jgi:hypothetical protein